MSPATVYVGPDPHGDRPAYAATVEAVVPTSWWDAFNPLFVEMRGDETVWSAEWCIYDAVLPTRIQCKKPMRKLRKLMAQGAW